MKNTLLFLYLVFLLVSCQEEKKAPELGVFSGTIENSNVDSLAVWRENFFTWVTIKKNGHFIDTLEIEEEGYYNFRVGNEMTSIFLSPHGIHSVSLNTEEFDESLKYSGQNAAENNYLAKKFLLSEKLSIAPADLKVISEDSIIIVAEKHQQEYLDLLQASGNLRPSFINLEKRAIKYNNRLLRENYVLNSSKGYYSGSDSGPSTTKILPEQLDVDNGEDYANFQDYQHLVSIDFFKETQLGKDTGTSSKTDKAFKYLEKLKSQNIKNSLLRSFSYGIRASAEDSEEIYELVMALSDDEEFKKDLTTKFNVLQKLKKGNPSPNFTYENYEGGQTSLSELQGKYVYIDVWATWCAPCIKEIPNLKAIEHQYADKKIHFVSLSIDTKKDYDKWKEMVSKEELGGIQLIADKDWNSDFIKNYAIDGIPRFILIDPEGAIVSADAPRPSDPALIELFNSLQI